MTDFKPGDFNTVIFDLDGTLVDSRDAVSEAFNHSLLKNGLETIIPEDFSRRIGMALEELFRFYAPHGSDITKLVNDFREHYPKVMLSGSRPIKGSKELLETLEHRGMKMAVATSKPRYFAEPVLAHHGLLEYFDNVTGVDEIEHPKPEPDVVLLAIERCRSKPGQCLYIGDTPFDVHASHAAGITACCVTSGHGKESEIRAAGPDAVFAGLLQIRLLFSQPEN